MQEMQVRSLGQEDPLEKEIATHSGILAWEIPWAEEPGGLQFMGSQRVTYDLATKQLNKYNAVACSFKVYLSSNILHICCYNLGFSHQSVSFSFLHIYRE